MDLKNNQPAKEQLTNNSKETVSFSDDNYQQISFAENKKNKNSTKLLKKQNKKKQEIKDTKLNRNKEINKEVNKEASKKTKKTTEDIKNKDDKNINNDENKKIDAVQLQMNTEKTDNKDKFEDIEETVKKQSTKKKKWMSLLFFIINIGIVAGILTYQILNENGLTSIAQISSRINWGVITLLVFLFFTSSLLNASRFWLLINKATGKNRFATAYKVAALGQYYDNITPFATGGEAFQVFYLNKRGIPAAEALSIPIARYVFWQISFSLFSLIIMLFSISLSSSLNAGGAIVTAGSWIGFAINSTLMLVVGIISISKKVGTKLVSGVLKFLSKIKIVKNYEKQYNKIMKLVDEFQNTMRTYAKQGWVFASMIILTLCFFVIQYSFPFFIHAAFFGFDWSIFTTIFTYGVMISLASSFFPLPGGTGAAELSFTALFSMFFTNGTIFWAMIIWRVLTFYAPILQGLVVLAYDYLIGNKRFEWEEKKWALEAESKAFEEAHLKEFENSLQANNKKRKNKRSKK